jgi:hypothetical protein
MAAIIKACKITTTVKNTGKECDSAMVATAMIIAMTRGLKITNNDLSDPVTWLTALIQQRKAFPLFGQQAPIREITNDTEGDQIVTLDDGLKVFLRYGMYNRTFATTSGGLCYAESLQSFLNSGMDVAEVDQIGQLLLRQNSNDPLGDYSPLITDFMYAPAPILPDFKTTPYKNRFSYSYSPVELVSNGVIFKGATALLSMMGLINVNVLAVTGVPPTATTLTVDVKTDCAEDDLVAKFPTAIVTAGNFIVTNIATGAVVTATATIVAGHLKLTGVFPTTQKFRVTGAAPSVWQTNLIVGYDASQSFVDFTIP